MYVYKHVNSRLLSSANDASREGDFCLLNRGVQGTWGSNREDDPLRENEIRAQRRPLVDLSSLSGYALSNTMPGKFWVLFGRVFSHGTKRKLYSRPSQTSTVSEKQNSNLAKPGQTPLNFIKEKPVTRTSCLGGKACCPLTLVLPPSSPTYTTSFHDSSRGCMSTCCSLHLQS